MRSRRTAAVVCSGAPGRQPSVGAVSAPVSTTVRNIGAADPCCIHIRYILDLTDFRCLRQAASCGIDRGQRPTNDHNDNRRPSRCLDRRTGRPAECRHPFRRRSSLNCLGGGSKTAGRVVTLNWVFVDGALAPRRRPESHKHEGADEVTGPTSIKNVCSSPREVVGFSCRTRSSKMSRCKDIKMHSSSKGPSAIQYMLKALEQKRNKPNPQRQPPNPLRPPQPEENPASRRRTCRHGHRRLRVDAAR